MTVGHGPSSSEKQLAAAQAARIWRTSRRPLAERYPQLGPDRTCEAGTASSSHRCWPMVRVTRGGRWAASLDVRFMTSCVRRMVECALRTVIPPWQHEDMVSPRRRLADRRRRLAAGRSHEYENTRTREHKGLWVSSPLPHLHTHAQERPSRTSFAEHSCD